MGYEIEADYSKRYLMPPSVEEWVPKNHFARFIREFVDNLDYSSLGLKNRKRQKGRPNYSNSLLIKVWLYGYFEQIYSSRKLEKACKDLMPLIWLTGMNYPDHNTIWRFFRNNQEAVKIIFKQTVRLAIKSDMVGFALQAVDGTKIKANTSKHRTLHKADLKDLLSKLDESVDGVIKAIESTEEQESCLLSYNLPKELCDEKVLKKAIQKGLDELTEEEKVTVKRAAEKSLEELTELGVNHLSLSDKEARLMKSGNGLEYSYNAQAVADEKCQIIVSSSLNNFETDYHNLEKSIDDVKENTGRAASEMLADSGYFSGESLFEAEQRSQSVLINIPFGVGKSTSIKNEIANKEDFIYDEQQDCYYCPHGKSLRFERLKNNVKKSITVRLYRCRNFRECPYNESCCRDKRGRSIERGPYDDNIKRQIEKQSEANNKRLLAKRKSIIEPVFGWLKFNRRFNMFNYRGMKSAEAQWNLICAIVNLDKLYRKWLNDAPVCSFWKKQSAAMCHFDNACGLNRHLIFVFHE